MGYIIFAAFITLLAVAAILASRAMRTHKIEGAGIVSACGFGVLVVGNLVVAVWSSVYQVPTGHLGIVYSFGAIDGQTAEGLQFVAPWKSVQAASTQVQSRLYKELDSFSRETQNVYVAATVNFHVSPDKIQYLYRTVGPNYAEVLIDPRVYQDFKDATVQYSSVDIAPHRDDIRKTVRDRITDELHSQSIIVDDVLLNNVSFSKQFEASIENKQIQSQNALAAAEQVKVKAQEAQQAIETAKGSAEAALIKAQKEAQANEVLTKSISPELIRYLTVQKLAPNVSVMMIPAGNQFILGSDVLRPNATK